MFFIVLMDILRCWYHVIIWPILCSFYSYLLLVLWIGLMACISYIFSHKRGISLVSIGVAILKSASLGLLCATFTIALYDIALCFTAESSFFTPYKHVILNCVSHMPFQSTFSLRAEQRILTILFLSYSFLGALYFVPPCSYQLQDDRVYQKYAFSLYFASVICYLVFMFLGYV